MKNSRKSLQHRPFVKTYEASDKSRSEWIARFQQHLNGQAQAECFNVRNKIAGHYRTMRVRSFGKTRHGETPTLVIPPLAVHDAGFLDLVPDNSLVGTLLSSGVEGLHVADWLRVTPDTAEQSIDACLADLSIAIDDLGGCVNVVGLCLGGIFGLLLAARFPAKVAKLVLAGTPGDVDVRPSTLTLHARKLAAGGPKAMPVDIVAAEPWLAPLALSQEAEREGFDAMQRDPGSFSRADLNALSAFNRWAERKGDLSAHYIRDLLTRIFVANELAKGSFIALGRVIELKTVRAPIFLLAGARDDVAPPRQVLSILDLVGTPKARQRKLVVPAGHLALYMGMSLMKREWRMIAGWLQSQAPLAKKAA